MLTMPNSERLDLNSGDQQKVAIVMAATSEMRILGREALKRVLHEHSQIIDADSADTVIGLMSGLFRNRVGLVLAFEEKGGGGRSQAGDLAVKLHVDGGENGISMPSVPLFLAVDPVGGNDDIGDFAKSGFVDDIVDLPLKNSEILAVFKNAIARRCNLLGELESVAKIEVLKEFIDYYLTLAGIWKKTVLKLSIAPKPVEEIGSDSPQDDVNYILKGIDGIIIILENLKNRNLSIIPFEVLQKSFHDLNNSLSLVIGFSVTLREFFSLPAEDIAIFELLEKEANQMSAHMQEIRKGYNGNTFWQNIKKAGLVLRAEEKLDIPVGISFCVIDDAAGILNITGRVIEAAEGSAVLVDSKEALEKLFSASGDGGSLPNIQVFLLDNNLGDGVFGHQLIPLIRSKYPDALILAHTSDSLSLNNDPENEYKKAGVEIIGKREWSAISEVVGRKVRKADGKMSA